MAADVYTNPQHAGRGGWTWYTGSAGRMYDVHYRFHDTVFHIHVRNLGTDGQVVTRVACDGVEQPDRSIPLHDDRQEHRMEIDIG